MKLHCSGVTSFHNWYDLQKTIPQQLIHLATQAGMIGEIDWIAKSDDKKKEVQQSESTWIDLLMHKPRRTQIFRIGAGGEKPSPWKMVMALFPFDTSRNRAEGANIANFWFDSKTFPGKEGSDRLIQAFRTMFPPEHTDFAMIHPYEHYMDLSDMTKDGPYERPITKGHTFSGVYWAIFLGRHHLEYFDRSKLQDLDCYRLEWMGDEGLFLQVSPEITKAPAKKVEKEMLRLTEIFRSARI